MNSIPTKTTYLEMTSPVSRAVAIPPMPDLAMQRVYQPSVEYYRFLYSSVGRDLYWVDRLPEFLSDAELESAIHDERVEIYVLHVHNQPAGYTELDRRKASEIEIAYFGLFPQYIGQGLGKYLLDWTLERAWSHLPSRVWVHTCDLDHPAALANYLRAGFHVYNEQVIEQAIPDG